MPDATSSPPRSLWRRAGRIALIAVGSLLGIGVLAITVLLVGANTGPGRRMLVRQTESLTGGMVRLAGLSGRFPDNLHVATLAIHDRQGAWLTLHDVRLDWSPLAMVWRQAKIYAFTAGELDIPRLPVSDATPQPTPVAPSAPSALRLGVDIRRLEVGRINVGAPLAGQAASFRVSGHGKLANIDPVINGLSLPKLPQSDIALQVTRLDQAGQIGLATATGKGRLALHLSASEGAGGFAATGLGMPQLAPVALKLDMQGSPAATTLAFDASAGAISARARGTLDLLGQQMSSLELSAQSPQLSLTPDMGWQAVRLAARLNGKMAAPHGTAQLDVDQLAASGVQVGTLSVRFAGEGGSASALAEQLHLTLTADGVRLPGKAPTMLAAAPLKLDALLKPAEPGMPVVFTLDHPVLALSGKVRAQAPQNGTLSLNVPDLLPVGEAAGVPLRGHADLNAQFDRPLNPQDATHLVANGILAITGGQAQAAGLLGPDGHFALAAAMHPLPAQGSTPAGQQIDLSSLTLAGQALDVAVQGHVQTGRTVDMTANVSLPTLEKLAPTLRGDTTLTLALKGPLQDFVATLGAKANLGTATMPKGALALDATVAHLPSAPQGTLALEGTLDRAPAQLDMAFGQAADGTRHLDLQKLAWNTTKGQGALTLAPKEVVPQGSLDLTIGRLADYSPLVGQKIAGSMAASVTTTTVADKPVVALKFKGNVVTPAIRVGSIALAGSVTDPVAHPTPDMTLRLGGLSVAGVSGQALVSAKGPDTAMLLSAQVGPASWSGSPLALNTQALLDLPDKNLKLQKLTATAKQETLRLQAPVLVSFGETLGIDRLRAVLGTPGSQPATLDVAGRIKPTLSVTADIRNVTPALAHPFMPDLHATGVVSLNARLSGALDKPEGKVQIRGSNLRMADSSAAASVPAMEVDATANLARTLAQVQVNASAGSKLGFQVRGSAPLSKTGQMDLRADGHLDLSIANGILGAQARQAQGQVQMALQVRGSPAAPAVTGAIDLINADFQDFAQGFHLSAINGRVVGARDRIVIQSLSAKAGDGTLGGSGFVGVAMPGMPIDLRLFAKKARPVSSDLLTAVLNADITIRGQVRTRMDVVGGVDLQRVEINIPNSLPASIARLDVIRPGEEKQRAEEAKVASTHQSVIGLDLKLTSPGKFFVRGHGLDAEMAGRLMVTGTAQAPVVTGGFDLKRGNFDLAGISLNFTKGRVGFNGSGVGHQLDPTLDFQADRAVEGQTAMLKVGGYASAPKISFDSMPALPQDQVLAMLLFGTDARSLSSTQMIEVGTALATLTGLTTFDPMGTLRKTLHLDRLTVGGGSGVGNGGTSVEAGKYVMKGVYVGAKQATSGSGTQAQVQVDLTNHLKLNTTVGTGGSVTGFTTPENDPGSSVGLLWQYRY
ncbi:translocation/assembly module TamB domain-containing protein [Acetobacter sp. LMG 32666]|uniref:translocation/assembly module TamB domain-containing protein n=1 Tax=Acetobacter sp. LMG 32666 TaxID=2959295 RepID=UPI0030C8A084